MPLQETAIVVQFRGGVETKEDAKGVLPTKLLALENAVFTKAVSLVKRNGYEDLGSSLLGSSAAIPQPLALGRRGNELLAFADDTAYSHVADASGWVEAGTMQSVITSHRPVAKTGTNQTIADVAVSNGIALYGWEDSAGGVWYAVLDDATDRLLIAPTQADALGTRPRCLALGDNLHLVFAQATARELRLLRFDANQPTLAPSASTLVADLHGTVPRYDIDTDDEKAVIAWHSSVGNIGVAYIHSSGALGGVGLGLPVPVYHTGTVSRALAVAIDKTWATEATRQVAIAWTDTQVRYRVLDQDLDAAFATRAVSSGATSLQQVTLAFCRDENAAGDRDIWVVWEDDIGSPRDALTSYARVTTATSGYSTPTAAQTRGICLGSKAFLDENEVYVHLIRESTLYRTYFTVRASDRLVVARFLSGLAAGQVQKAHLPSVIEGDDGREHSFAGVYVTDVESANGDVFTESGIRRIELDYESPEAFRSAQLGGTTYIAGGLVHAYDGERISEAGFHYGIDDIGTPTQGAPAGTGIAPGTRAYVAVLESILANGEVERGPVSAPVTVVVAGANRAVTLAIPTLRLTAKRTVRIGVYRTEDGDASAYYRVSSLDPNDAGAVNGYLANDVTVDTVTFVDEMTDATLLSQEPLYSNGGIVMNDPLGGARLIATGKNRVFVVDAADPLAVYFSQELAEGYAVELSPLLRLTVDPYGGPISGLVVMDDALIIFKETAVFYVGGPGPLANPDVGGGWSMPELITSDVGCISPDSIGYTPVGVLFQSRKGIYLLGRDKSTSYIGASVEAYNAQNVVATTLIEDKTQIRLLTDAGSTLLYDYLFGQWSTFTNHEGQDAITVGGVYHYLRNNGAVWRETEGQYRDVNRQIRRRTDTAWLKLAQHAQGWQYLWWMLILGTYRSPHTLRVRIAYDYQDNWSEPIPIDVAEGMVSAPYGGGAYGAGPYGGAPDTRYQFEIHIGQECEAVKFRFEDFEAAGDAGACFELTELLLTGGVARTRYQVEHARSW